MAQLSQILQIVGLFVVVIGFAGLVLWTYSPKNKARYEAGSMLPLDNPPNAEQNDVQDTP